MKKFGMLLICTLLLMGCRYQVSQSASVQKYKEPQIKTIYQYQDFLLYIVEDQQKSDGFSFQIELNGTGIGDYAKYTDASHHQATCTLSMQPDCQLTFTFEKNEIIVKATEEDNFLGTDLSGHYVLQEDLS